MCRSGGFHQPSQPTSSMTSAVAAAVTSVLWPQPQEKRDGHRTCCLAANAHPFPGLPGSSRKQSWETNTAALSVESMGCRDHSSVPSVPPNGQWQPQRPGRSKVSHQHSTHRYWLFASNVRCAGNPADGLANSLFVKTRVNVIHDGWYNDAHILTSSGAAVGVAL